MQGSLLDASCPGEERGGGGLEGGVLLGERSRLSVEDLPAGGSFRSGTARKIVGCFNEILDRWTWS